MDDGTRHVFFYENRREDEGGGRKVSGHGEDDEVLRPFREWFESLSDDDQICWAYGINPSQYQELARNEVWYDVTYKLRVRLGEATVGHLQQHYSMVKILSAAFGGDSKSNAVKVKTSIFPSGQPLIGWPLGAF